LVDVDGEGFEGRDLVCQGIYAGVILGFEDLVRYVRAGGGGGGGGGGVGVVGGAGGGLDVVGAVWTLHVVVH